MVSSIQAGKEETNGEEGLASRKKFYIGIGGIFLNFDTEGAIHSPTLGRGTRISLERDLGYDEENVDFRLEGSYRFGKKHRLGFGYLLSDRDGLVVLRREIQIGEDIYGIGAELDSTFRNQVIKATYHYSFVNKPDLDVGFIAGFSIFDIDLEVNARGMGDISGVPGDDPFKEEDEFIFPVPVIGFHFNYRIAPRWVFVSNLEYFAISYDDWKGSLVDWKAAVDFSLSPRWGILGGFGLVRIDYSEEDLDGWDFDYDYGGFLGAVTYSF